MLGFNRATALKPTSLPKALESDFLDPTVDGSDVAWYATNIQNLAPGSSAQISTLQIDAGVDFYWMMTTLQADVAGASRGGGAYTESNIVNPLVNILVTDSASGKKWGNLKFPIGSFAGFGERCYRLVQPRRIAGSTQLSFAYTSIDAAATYANVFVVLHGYIFPAANLPYAGGGG